MASKKTFKVQFKRRREGKTNYKRRRALLSSNLPRLVVRKSNRHVTAQVIEFSPKGDKTLAHANSKELERFGWGAGKNSLPAAYLTGLLTGSKAKGKKVEKAVLDIGFATPVKGSAWSAALKGALDSGLKINAGEEALPAEERVKGKHIAEYASKLGEEKAKKIFSDCAKRKVDLKGIEKMFNTAKGKILKQGAGERNAKSER